MKLPVLIGIALVAVGTIASHAAEARELYEENCVKCHGPDGKGKTKMAEKVGLTSDFSDAKVQERLKDDEMIKVIKEGVREKDTGKKRMRGYEELSEKEMRALVTYIRTFNK